MLSFADIERAYKAKSITPSVIEALRYYCGQNNGRAWMILGNCYRNGWVVPKDNAKGAECIMKGVNLGDISAMGAAASSLKHGSGGFVKNEGLAIQLEAQAFRLALPKAYSDASCAYTVGRAYYYAEGGISKDYPKAYEYLTVSARLGSSDALVLFASMYQYGQYVRKDISEARRLLEKAVAMGNDIAKIDIKYL